MGLPSCHTSIIHEACRQSSTQNTWRVIQAAHPRKKVLQSLAEPELSLTLASTADARSLWQFFVWARGEMGKKEKTAICRPMTMETRCCKIYFQTIQKRNRLKILSYRRYGENGEKKNAFWGLFVHAAVRGGTCAFTMKIVNTLIKNSSRDDRPSISI